MIGSCIVQRIFQQRHRENGISGSKSFDEAGAYSYDTMQSIPPRSKGLGMSPTTITPKLSNSEIVCHPAEHNDPQNSAKITKMFE